ncbi:hypothetical protein MSAN_01647200 [Mycena sanguinolenta]|uniref:DUF5648 domain-containing protein n=1 Tax=Mycena sanguinolenta TaxID=230812 RepID=A0A8H6Y269_9AGAR|nr:hypothetical protein MSAN_01647200 [Mycena sanguinolenta]
MNSKHILTLILSVAVSLIAALNTTGIDAPQAARGVSLLLRRNLRQSASERGGWTLQTVAALVFVTQEVSTVPFYRLGASGETLYTANTTEMANALKNGYTHILPDVYIYPTQICGSVPFYYLQNAAKKSNFYTTSESERLAFIANEGYTDVEIAGYVLPLGCSQCT